MLGKTEGRRRRGRQRTRWLDGISDSVDRTFKQTLRAGEGREVRHAVDHGVPMSQTRLSY